jgi:hypothetical protein
VPDPRLPKEVDHKAREASFRVQARAFYKPNESWGDTLADVAFKPLTDVLFHGKAPTISPLVPPTELGAPQMNRRADGSIEVICSTAAPCSFETSGPTVALVPNIAPTDAATLETNATLVLADRERRRLDVFHRLRDKAVKMVEKSVEKHKAAKAFARITPTDLDLDKLLTEKISAKPPSAKIEFEIVQTIPHNELASRVRLSRLFFTKARAEEKAGFRRPSENVTNWSNYTFRVVGTSPLHLDPSDKYPRQYWVRLEDGPEPPEEEADALFGISGKKIAKVDRQYLLPIPADSTPTRGTRTLTQTAFVIEGPVPPHADQETMKRQRDLIAQGVKASPAACST